MGQGMREQGGNGVFVGWKPQDEMPTPDQQGTQVWHTHFCPRRLNVEDAESTGKDASIEGLPDSQVETATQEMEAELPAGGESNLTLGAVVTATLSANVQGCHCNTQEFRQCGSKCFSRPQGGSRINCISVCLQGHHHSHGCSESYARRSDCTMVHCLNKCASNPHSAACIGCVHSKCGGD